MKIVRGAALGLVAIGIGALLLAILHTDDAPSRIGPRATVAKSGETPPPPTSAEANGPLIVHRGERPSPSELIESIKEDSELSAAEKKQQLGEAERLRDSVEEAGAQSSLFYAGNEPLRYNDGYVQHRPHVHVTFWGKGWNSQGTTKEKILDLYKWISGSSYASILSQYFDHNGPIGIETATRSPTQSTTRAGAPPTTKTNTW